MKETQWRSKLVATYKRTQPSSFIWAMDAKFKAGFPDLYIIDQEGGRGKHFELKVCTQTNGISMARLRNYFDPIQISVMRSIQKAGGSAIGMVLNLATKNVYLFDPLLDIMFILNPVDFHHWWSNTSHSWLEAEAIGSTDEASPAPRQLSTSQDLDHPALES